MPGIEVNITAELLAEITAGSRKIAEYYKLGHTEVIESIEWKYRDESFVLLANDYLTYIDSGRRPRARKIPVVELIKWLRKKNIKPRYGQTINSLAYAIQNSIYKSGIRAKHLLDPMMNQTLDVLEEYLAEDLSASIADEIAETMTFNLP